MSMSRGLPRGRSDAVGETVARYSDYDAAQKAVSRLIAAEVPARDIAIVGIGLRSIERITGRLGYATAARSGAMNGLLLGMLFSAFLVLGTSSPPIQAFVGVLFVGIALGMLLSIVAYSFVRRRRDYASVMQVVADHYDVTVAASGIHKARQVIGASPVPFAGSAVGPSTPSVDGPPQTVPPGPAPSPPVAPPQYGERIPPRAGGGTPVPAPVDDPIDAPEPIAEPLPPGGTDPPAPARPAPAD